ncbi:MAG TPA: ATP-grasp domain-containing protein, partial [Gemmatimonadales bacterium]|nr:ATP-grasp domain-containing protein [Gemmatimonadales bacterium]
RVLIAGISARALAESAARAGYRVLAVDGFGDLDLRRVAEVRLARDARGRVSPGAAVRAARGARAEAVVYVASFENHPRAVRTLAAGRTLWGNPPEVLARVRDPLLVAATLARHGLPTPAVRATAPRSGGGGRSWLAKPRASGGGSGVVAWRPGRRAPRDAYFQERIAGVPGSIVFAADGRRAVPLGLTCLLAGERAFGAVGFRYCGSILVGRGDAVFTDVERLCARAIALAEAITRAFGLVGVNGIDFIARRGTPYPIEVNPRYTAAMELVERAYGLSIFDIHARACAGHLPAFDLAAARHAPLSPPRAIGKAILYARGDVVLGDTRPWLEDDSVRDVSAPGERCRRGQPICTIFAAGRDAVECRAALGRRAAVLYAELEAHGPCARSA